MLDIRRVTDIKEAQRLWRALSPHKFIFDDWDFRFTFYKYETYPVDFYAAYERCGLEEILVGLMPLQVNPEYGREFFSEVDCEENRPFVKAGYEKIIPDLYAAIEGPAKCFDISGNDSFTAALPLEDYIYVLPLAGLSSFEDFLSSRLSPKKRRNIKQELKEIEKDQPEIVWNNKTDIESLFALNIKNFGEDSYLNVSGQRAWRELLNPAWDYHLVALKINQQIAAASLAIYYNHTYYYLINGVSHNTHSLGKYLNKINIEKAISLGADYFDAGLGDCNWKEAWHFDRVPQYKFIKLK